MNQKPSRGDVLLADILGSARKGTLSASMRSKPDANIYFDENGDDTPLFPSAESIRKGNFTMPIVLKKR